MAGTGLILVREHFRRKVGAKYGFEKGQFNSTITRKMGSRTTQINFPNSHNDFNARLGIEIKHSVTRAGKTTTRPNSLRVATRENVAAWNRIGRRILKLPKHARI